MVTIILMFKHNCCIIAYIIVQRNYYALRTHNLPTSRCDVAAAFENKKLPFQVDLRL